MEDLVLLLLWIVFGAVGWIMAERKRRHKVGWGVAAFLFPPILLVLAVLPDLPTETYENR